MRRFSRLWAIALAGACVLPSSASAQRLTVWLDATAAHARSPAGVAGSDAATYGLLGARLRLRRASGITLDAALSGGRGAESRAGTWLRASGAAALARSFGRISLGVRAGAFGLDYAEPFSYTVYAGRVRPHLSVRIGGAVLRGEAALIRGRWHGADATGRLAVTGGALELGTMLGPVRVDATAERYHARNAVLEGDYRGVGAGLTTGGNRWTASLRGRLRDTPRGTEIGYRAGLRYLLDERLAIRIGAGKTTSDLLHGTEGTFAASIGLSWRIGGPDGSGEPDAERVRVVRVLGAAGDGRRVRFQFRAPDAEQVALVGDFSGWEPLPLRRHGGAWRLEVTLGPGLHHFAFLINGERWTVPDHAPGVTSDGWGRRNASIVIEGT